MNARRNGEAASIAAGIIMIALGALFFLAELAQVDLGPVLWPYVVIGTGVAFFVAALILRGEGSALAIPGSIIGVIGVILLAQMLFGHWESWAYAWGLIVASVGLGIFSMGVIKPDPEAKRSGLNLANLGLTLFLIFGAFFEALFSMGNEGGVSRILWPLALILLGTLILLRRGLLWLKLPDPAPQIVSSGSPDKPAVSM